MKNKINIVAIAVMAIAITACEKRTDYFEFINKQPEIIIVKNNYDTLLNNPLIDTMKIGFDKSYKIFILDEERKLEIIKNVDEGLHLSGSEIINLKADNEGIKSIKLSTIDYYGKENERIIEMYVFENMEPVGILQVEKVQNNEVEIKASQSYDKDARFGGKIIQYEYNLNGVIILTSLSEIRYNFGSSGTKRIELRVKDNNNKYSSKIFKYIDL